MIFPCFLRLRKQQKVKPHPESIAEYSILKVRTYLTMKAMIINSLAALNRQVENFQGQSLNIEGPQRETCRERERSEGRKSRKNGDEGSK